MQVCEKCIIASACKLISNVDYKVTWHGEINKH